MLCRLAMDGDLKIQPGFTFVLHFLLDIAKKYTYTVTDKLKNEPISLLTNL